MATHTCTIWPNHTLIILLNRNWKRILNESHIIRILAFNGTALKRHKRKDKYCTKLRKKTKKLRANKLKHRNKFKSFSTCGTSITFFSRNVTPMPLRNKDNKHFNRLLLENHVPKKISSKWNALSESKYSTNTWRLPGAPNIPFVSLDTEPDNKPSPGTEYSREQVVSVVPVAPASTVNEVTPHTIESSNDFLELNLPDSSTFAVESHNTNETDDWIRVLHAFQDIGVKTVLFLKGFRVIGYIHHIGEVFITLTDDTTNVEVKSNESNILLETTPKIHVLIRGISAVCPAIVNS